MPNIDKTCFVADGAVVKGNVTIGPNSSVWYNAVVRIEEDQVVIGRDTNIQDCTVVHGDAEFPVTIGDRVTIGHTCIIHGCTIGDDTMIGMGSTVLNGCVIGKNCLIAAGSFLREGTIIPDNSFVVGNPAFVKREMNEHYEELVRYAAPHYVEMGRLAKAEQEKERAGEK